MKVLPAPNATPELSAGWWKHLFEASSDGQMVCRDDGIVEQINPRAARLFNLNPARDEGSFSIFKILSSPADKKLEVVWQRGLKRPDTLHSVTLKTGDTHSLVDLELMPLGGGFTLLTFKEASRRLRLESHVQRLVTAIDATPDAFFITDAEMRITF